MNKKDSVPHKENATRMNIQLKKKKFQACRKQENMTLKEEKKTYIYISTETNSEPAQMLALADNVVTQLL